MHLSRNSCVTLLISDSDSKQPRCTIVRANGFPMHCVGRSVADSSNELEGVGIAMCTYLGRPCGACKTGASGSSWTVSTARTGGAESDEKSDHEPDHEPDHESDGQRIRESENQRIRGSESCSTSERQPLQAASSLRVRPLPQLPLATAARRDPFLTLSPLSL